MVKTEWYQLIIITKKSGIYIRRDHTSIKECLRQRDVFMSMYDCRYKIVDIEGNIYHQSKI